MLAILTTVDGELVEAPEQVDDLAHGRSLMHHWTSCMLGVGETAADIALVEAAIAAAPTAEVGTVLPLPDGVALQLVEQ